MQPLARNPMTPPIQPTASLASLDRFERLHCITAAVLRLFIAGEWTLANGRTIEAALRALLLTWNGGRPREDDIEVDALLAALNIDDLFDPAVIADRGPLVEHLLSLRDRSLLDATRNQSNRHPRALEPFADDALLPTQWLCHEAHFTNSLSRAFNRLYQENESLNEHTIVSVADPNGTIVEANTNFCQISGYTREELLGATHAILKSGRHSQHFYREMWRTITSGRIWTGEVCNRRKDHLYYWVQITIIPLLAPDGSPTEYVSIATELTDEKVAEERLTLLECAILAHGKGLAIADPLRAGFPITSVNASFASLFERNEHELHEMSLLGLLAENQPAEVFNGLKKRFCSTESGSFLLRGAGRTRSRSLDVCLSPVLKNGIITHFVAVIDDVTEREALRDALHDQNERLRRSEERLGFGTWEWDMAADSLRWSAGVGPIFGLPRSRISITSKDFLACVHPQDRRSIRDAIEACRTLDKPYEIEHRCVWPDGNVRWVYESGNILRDERGRPSQMFGIARDITDRRQLQQDLQHEHARLRRIQALARIGDWRISTAPDRNWCSEIVPVIYHRDPASFRPTIDTFVLAADPRDARRIREALDKARTCEDIECVHRILLPTGERRWVRLLAGPERSESGTIVGIAGTVQDETETVQREECARLLRQLAAMGEDAIAIADHRGEFLYANAIWRRMLGLDPERQPHGTLLAACESPAREAIEREMQHGNPSFRHRGDIPMRRMDGTVFVARGEIAASRGAYGELQYFLHRFRDASDALAHEDTLASMQARLEDALNASGRFIVRASGALRGPSQSILASAQLLSARPELSSIGREYARQMLNAARNLLLTMGDMLDLARAEAGRLSLRIEPVTLDAVFADLVQTGERSGTGTAHISLPESDPLSLLCDRMRLVQVLSTLIGETGRSPPIAARITVHRDAGTPTNTREYVAIRIIRASCTEGPDDARKLATLLLMQMDATLEARRTGVETLTVRVPLAPLQTCTDEPSRPTIDLTTTRESVSSNEEAKVTVLKIGDDPEHLSLLQLIFQGDSRIRLLLSPLALLSVELAQTQRPDVLLLDTDSTSIDAFALVRELRIDPRTHHVPMVALTTDTSEHNRDRLRRHGFHRYIEKPISLPELLRIIDECSSIHRSNPSIGIGSL